MMLNVVISQRWRKIEMTMAKNSHPNGLKKWSIKSIDQFFPNVFMKIVDSLGFLMRLAGLVRLKNVPFQYPCFKFLLPTCIIPNLFFMSIIKFVHELLKNCFISFVMLYLKFNFWLAEIDHFNQHIKLSYLELHFL